jgi:hypothetical protein
MPVKEAPARRTHKRYGYTDVMSIAERPGDSRRLMPIGRGGAKVAPRKFHLNDDEVASLRQKHRDGDKLPNPQNRGSYFYIIEAGKHLGVNKKHPIKAVIATIRELMSDKETLQDGKTAWQRFRDKAPATENAENALSTENRIIQNMEVLQRVNTTSCTPYGLKLLQVGQKVLRTHGVVIDLLKGDSDKEILFRLNTDSAVPVNELKRRRGSGDKPATRQAEKDSRKPKVKAKARKVVAAAKAEGKVKPAPADRKRSGKRAAKTGGDDAVTAAKGPDSDDPSATAAAEPAADIASAV